MAEETKFTKAEVKFMYRAFKTECPNGIIDEETFKGLSTRFGKTRSDLQRPI